MRVRSKLADVEFLVGSIERKGNDLVVNSDPDQPLKSRIYISPADALTLLGKLIRARPPGYFSWVSHFSTCARESAFRAESALCMDS